MKTLKNKKLEIIEALRGFAAIYVVIHHFFGFTKLKGITPEFLHFPFRFGQEVVLLFFLMSGFVIFTANQNIEKVSFNEYFKKRFIRIYPTFILTLILSLLVLLINRESLMKNDLIDLMGNIFMLQDTGNKPGAIVFPFLKNYPLWSLSYEWWFYMLFFPISFYLNKTTIYKKVPSIYFILLISIISYFLYLILPNHIFLILSHLIIWWTGIYIAQLYFSDESITFKTLLPIYISLILMILASSIPLTLEILNKSFILNPNDYPFIDFRHFTFTLILVLIGNLLYQFRIYKWQKLIKPFENFAPISYAMYCVHFPIILLKIPFITNQLVLFLTKIFMILIISYIFEMILQPQFQRLIKVKNLSKQSFK